MLYLQTKKKGDVLQKGHRKLAIKGAQEINHLDTGSVKGKEELKMAVLK